MNRSRQIIHWVKVNMGARAFLFFLLVTTAKAAAIAPDVQANSPEEIIALSIKALGGQKAVRRIQSIKAVADCMGPRSAYTTEITSMRGDRLVFKQSWPDGRSFLGYVNGKYVWTKDGKTGDVAPADRKLAAMLRSHEFQMIAIAPLERYRNPVMEDDEEFAGARCLKLRMTNELGKTCHVFFNAESHLMAGLILVDPRSETGETVRVVFNEWARVGGVRLPSKVTATDKSGDFVLRFHNITLNQADGRAFAVPPKIPAMAELLQLHEQQRAAHFNRDASQLVSMFAPDYIEINAGKVSRPTIEESRKRFQSYFARSTFLEWDDISPPVIRVSDDARMAYIIVHKRVKRKDTGATNEPRESTTVFAWMETYEKRQGKWALTALASTNEPPTR